MTEKPILIQDGHVVPEITKVWKIMGYSSGNLSRLVLDPGVATFFFQPIVEELVHTIFVRRNDKIYIQNSAL